MAFSINVSTACGAGAGSGSISVSSVGIPFSTPVIVIVTGTKTSYDQTLTISGGESNTVTFLNLADDTYNIQATEQGSFNTVYATAPIACAPPVPPFSINVATACGETGAGSGSIAVSAIGISSAVSVYVTITGTNTGFLQMLSISGGESNTVTFTSLADDLYNIQATEQAAFNTVYGIAEIACDLGEILPPDWGVCDLYVAPPEVSGSTVRVEPVTTALGSITYSIDGGETFTDLPSDLIIRDLAVGEYAITIRDANGCEVYHAFSILPEYIEPGGYYPDDAEGERYRFYLTIGEETIEIAQPLDFEKLEFILKRDADLHGFFKLEFTELKLAFDCAAGRDLIRSAYQSAGSDAEVGFHVFRKSLSDCLYRELYSGEIDFNNYTDAGDEVRANVRKRAFKDKFRTRRKTKVNILADKDLDGNAIAKIEPSSITLHGKGISQEYNAESLSYQYATLDDELFIPSGVGTVARSTNKFLQFGFDHVTLSEIEDVYAYPLGFNDVMPAENYKAKYPGVHRISGTLNLRLVMKTRNDRSGVSGTDAQVEGCNRGVGNIGNLRVVMIVNVAGTEHYIFDRALDGCGLTGLDTDDKAVSFSFEQTLAADDTVTVYCWLSGGADYEQTPLENSRVVVTFEAGVYQGTFLKIESVTYAPGSLAKGYFLHEAASQLSAIITGRSNAFRSSYYGRENSRPRAYAFDGCGSPRFLLSGEAARQFPEPKLETSFDQLTDSLQAIDGVGFGLERENGADVIVSERLTYFYNVSHEVAKFDYPEDVEIEVASDYIFNEIEVGFKKWESEDKNGRDEIAGKLTYLTPIKTSEKKASFLSDFIGSGYLLEKTRRKNYTTTSKEDDQNDKNLFIVKTSETYGRVTVYGFKDNKNIRVPLSVITSGLRTGDKITLSGSGVNNGVYTVVSLVRVAVRVGLTNIWQTEIQVAETFPGVLTGGGSLEIPSIILAEKNEAFETLEGLISPATVYNADLAPGYNFARLGSWLNSGLYYKNNAEEYKFTTGEGNVTFTSKRASDTCATGDPALVTLTHNQNRAINSIDGGRRIFIPEIITFKTGVNEQQADAILRSYAPDDATPPHERYGFISVKTEAGYVHGFLLESRLSEKENNCKFTLLRADVPAAGVTSLEYEENEHTIEEHN